MSSGYHLSHIGRFVLTTFLINIGMTAENVMDYFEHTQISTNASHDTKWNTSQGKGNPEQKYSSEVLHTPHAQHLHQPRRNLQKNKASFGIL
jgi:hypothetical protein